MTRKRTSYTRKSAIRFLQYFNALVEQSKQPKPQGLFIPYSTFGGTQPSTIMNRLTDALLWLRHNKLEGNKHNPEDYEYLFAVMRKKAEETGIRFTLLSGGPVDQYLRVQTEVATPQDWKDKVVAFIENTEQIVEKFHNCSVSPSNMEWLEKVTTPIKAEFHVDGDVITIIKQG